MPDRLMAGLDPLVFAIAPYAIAVVFILGTIYRYRAQSFTYSSLSSQFLENRHHFWGSVPFHYGILAITAGHLIGFLIPRSVLAFNHVPLRLYVLEVAALIFAILMLVGLANIVLRRINDAKSRVVTSTADWIIYGLLLWQAISGIGVAIFYGWGSSWFATSAAPYLWSLAKFSPEIEYVTALPLLVKLHITGAFAVFGLFPFSRLVHILVVPNPYLWRRWQLVRWHWDRRTIRRAE